MSTQSEKLEESKVRREVSKFKVMNKEAHEKKK